MESIPRSFLANLFAAGVVVLLGVTAGWAETAAAAEIEDGGSPEESRQFDFWIGEWDVNLRIRQDDGSWLDKVKAAAKIYPILGGKAVLELWDSQPIKGFSLRYFDPSKGRWVLWLNWPSEDRSSSSGLEGSFRHGRGEFFTEYPGKDGAKTLARYTFSDITPDSLRWDDAFSEDGGTTWSHRWIMEFTRTGARPELPADRNTAHTYHTGERCNLEQFRRFDALAGRFRGTIDLRNPANSRRLVAAELVGHKVLDGCAVITTLSYEDEGSTFESFRFHTWSSAAQAFEETHLDSSPSTPLEVFYGAAADGTLEMLLSDKNDVEGGNRRHRWRITDGAIVFESETTQDDGKSWKPMVTATFER